MVLSDYQLDGEVNLNDPPADMAERISTETFYYRWNADTERDLRTGQTHHESFPTYPALSAPLGPEDELVCPPRHLNFLEDRLEAEEAIHLLVVGCSAYDKSALKILAESTTGLGSCYVVNRDHANATEVAMRIAEALGHSVNDGLFRAADESFGDWVQKGVDEYHRWVAGFNQRPETHRGRLPAR